MLKFSELLQLLELIGLLEMCRGVRSENVAGCCLHESLALSARAADCPLHASRGAL